MDYYAVWANASEDEWTETTLGNISSSDVVVIAGYDGEDYYGIKSAGSSSPTAIEITVEDGKITSEFDDENDNIKWNITGNATDGYSFYVNGGTEDDRLYCSTNNTSWRVGNPASGVNRYTLDWSSAKNTMVTKDNSTARYLCLYQGTDWRSYLVGSVTPTNLTFFKYSAGSTTNYTTNCVAPLEVDAPTFSPDGSAAYYTTTQSVTISCETENSTIYYTTDGTDPNNESTEYTDAFNVESTTTIKAIAYVGNIASEIATVTIMIHPILTTIPAIYAEAEAIGGTAEARTITFNNWVISGVSGSTAYITDGTNGFIIYTDGHGFAVNDKVNGTVECSLKLYSKAAEVVGLKKSDITDAGGSVTNDGVITPVAKAISALSGVNTGAPVIINNVTYNSENSTLVDENVNAIKPYTTLYDYGSTFVNNKIYSVTGIYLQFGNTKELLPRQSEDIVLESKEQPTLKWYVNNTKETEIGATYTINEDDVFAPYFESNSDGAKTYSSTVGTVASIDPSTGALSIEGVGETVISCAVEAHGDYLAGSKSFTLKVRPEGSGEVTWKAKDWADANSVGENESLEMTENAAGDYIDMSWAKGNNNNNAPKYYDNGKATRIYSSNTLTLTSKNSKIMTSITFTFSQGSFGEDIQNVGDYDTEKNQWTGFANSVTFTSDGTVRITQIDIEYEQGITSTLVIDDVELSMLSPAAQDIAYTSNRTNPTIVYSDYDDEVISISNGQIAPLAVGSTTVTASIAAAAPYSSVVTTFNVTVKSGQEVEESVVILAKKDGVWYALTNIQGSANNSLAGLEVDYFEPAGKILSELTDAQKTSITWKRITDGNSVTFQDANDKYLTGNGTSTNLSVAAEKCVWTKEDNDYWQINQTTKRTFLYISTDTYNYFRCYTATTGNVSGLPIFVASENIYGTTYTRTVTNGNYGTICLPNGGYLTNGTLYEISYYEASSFKIFFDEVLNGVMVAGMPYIFQPNDDVTELKVVYTDNASKTEAESDMLITKGLVGSLANENVEIEAGVGNYILYNNQYWNVDVAGSAVVAPNRAYIHIADVPDYPNQQPAPGRRRVSMNVNNGNQMPTDIEGVEVSEAPRKVVINGEMYIIRGERRYDVRGQLVK